MGESIINTPSILHPYSINTQSMLHPYPIYPLNLPPQSTLPLNLPPPGASTTVGKSYAFFSSRNNNFSNRDQTMNICVRGLADAGKTTCRTPKDAGTCVVGVCYLLVVYWLCTGCVLVV